MNTLAVTVRLTTLALTAALSSTAFAQTAGQYEVGYTQALTDAPLIENWEPTPAPGGEHVPTQSVEQALASSVEAMAEKLNEQLEAKMARKLELAI